MAFSENLKRIRKGKGMSQADLAKKSKSVGGFCQKV